MKRLVFVCTVFVVGYFAASAFSSTLAGSVIGLLFLAGSITGLALALLIGYVGDDL